MNTTINEPQITTNQLENDSPKKNPSKVFRVITIIAFIILVIGVIAIALYFGSKKSQADILNSNPVTIPANEINNLPANMNAVPPAMPPGDTIVDPNAPTGIPIQPEIAPQEIVPELPPTDTVPQSTIPIQ